MGPCVVVYSGVLGRCVDVVVCSVVCWHGYGVVWCGVLVWKVPGEWMLAPDRTSRLLGGGCWVGSAPLGVSY